MTNERPSFETLRRQDLAGQLDSSLLLFFGLSGTCTLSVREESFVLSKADLLVVNPYEFYRLHSSWDGSVICVRISESVLKQYGWSGSCRCYIKTDAFEKGTGRRLKELLAKTVQTYIERPRPETFKRSKDIQELLDLLKANYYAGPQSSRDESQRLIRIVNTIQAHFNENISLTGLAEEEFLSAGYLSRYLKKNLGMSLSQYVRELRLVHALQLLSTRNDTVTRIAYDCGFKSPSAFIEEFRQLYGMTPNRYRQKVEEEAALSHSETSELKSEAVNDIGILLSYIPEESMPELSEKTLLLSACRQKEQNVWKNESILNIGYARDLLLAPIQQQVRRAQKEIGFTYLRFHGLLDEDMHIYWEDFNGCPQYTFHYLDMVFDFLTETGLKAYVEFSFMPEQLAMEQTRIFDRPSIISGCRDLEKWQHLVQTVIRHLEERYSKETVRTWRFETICQSYVHLNCIAWADYQNLYKTTFHAIRDIDPQLQFGGPGCFAEMIGDEDGMPAFLKFASENSCLPDFISFQFYPHVHTYDPLFMDFTISQQSSPAILSEDPDYLKHSLDRLEALLTEYGIQNRELFISEGTSTLWQRDLSSDTCYKAAWLCKNAADSFGRAHFGYWLLTDLLEERARLDSIFHGGYGLMTYNGIPKAGYYAMVLLGKTGTQLIDRGPGYLLTASDKGCQLLLYNYCHYSNMYRYRYQKLTEPKDAYSVFEKGSMQHLQIQVEELEEGVYLVERREINRAAGSSFDKWLSLGAPSYPGMEETDFLKDCCLPKYSMLQEKIRGSFHIESVLPPHAVELITITKME